LRYLAAVAELLLFVYLGWQDWCCGKWCWRPCNSCCRCLHWLWAGRMLLDVSLPLCLFSQHYCIAGCL